MDSLTGEFNEDFDMNHVADSAMDEVQTGRVLKGEVVTIDSDYVYVNVGTKSDGRVPRDEFEIIPEIGQEIDVFLNNKRFVDGMYQFSHKQALLEAAWQKFLAWYKEGNRQIEGVIIESINKGKIIDCMGIKSFLPFSLAADLKNKNTSDETYSFIILDTDSKKRSLLISRKDFLDKEVKARWEHFDAHYKPGDIVKGTPVKFVEFGTFVRVEGIDALLHRNDMSWKKVFKQRKILKIGQERDFIILDINREEGKISLGLKQLSEDPWLHIEEKYVPGQTVSGKVSTIISYGAFVELEDEIEGYISNSELSWTKTAAHVKDFFEQGEVYDFQVLQVNKDERKLALGYKQLQPNPWDAIDEKFPVGSVHKSTIKKIVKFGMFVELDDGIDGLVHISDISWEDRVNNIHSLYSQGDQVEFVILDIKKDEMKISCGIKQLTQSPWEKIKVKYPPRTRVEGTVSGITHFGIFVRIEDDVEGLVHISEISRKRIESIEEAFNIGDRVNAVVLGVDVGRKRLSLSIKNYELVSEKEELDKIMKNTLPGTVTLGDMINLNEVK